MIIHDVEQGSEAWHKLRIGRPTASKFGEIISPKKLQPSASAEKYMHQLLAEWIIGQPCNMVSNKFMERGTELEPEARKLYELLHHNVDQIGFCTTDDGLVGCSPDGLIGKDGGLEIKCPMAPTHVKYLLDPAKLYEDYKLQVQGSIFVTGRSWWDMWSYAPGMPGVIYRVEPDDVVQNALSAHLKIFTQELEIFKQRLIERGIEPHEAVEARLQKEIDEPMDWDEVGGPSTP